MITAGVVAWEGADGLSLGGKMILWALVVLVDGLMGRKGAFMLNLWTAVLLVVGGVRRWMLG